MAEKPSKLPSLDLLKGFEAAARHLNFTKAADELFVTQSAVSRQVQALEAGLGVRLFVRQRRGLRLTYEGERLFRSVQGALRAGAGSDRQPVAAPGRQPRDAHLHHGVLRALAHPQARGVQPAVSGSGRAHRRQRPGAQPGARAHRHLGPVLHATGCAGRSGLALRRGDRAGVLSGAAGAHRQAGAASTGPRALRAAGPGGSEHAGELAVVEQLVRPARRARQ